MGPSPTSSLLLPEPSPAVDDEDGIQVLNAEGHQRSIAYSMLFGLLALLSGGLLLIYFKWFPTHFVRLTHRKVCLSSATVLIVKDLASGAETVTDVHEVPYQMTPTCEQMKVKLTTYRCLRYVLHHDNRFVLVEFNLSIPFSEIHSVQSVGLKPATIEKRSRLYGRNSIAIPRKPTYQIVIDETLHPFSMFQFASVVLWSMDDYWTYATCICLITFITITVSVRETIQTLTKLQKMSEYQNRVHVLRNGQVTEIDADELVPGDVVEIESNMDVPCDLVLISGVCIVNESMLTGESVPVTKPALPKGDEESSADMRFDPETNGKHILFSGTKVIQSRRQGKPAVRAVVFRVGFITTKGKLLRSMMFPKPTKFKFYEDSIKFIWVMCAVASVGFTVSIIQNIEDGVPTREIIFKALDLVTVVVPPALPAAMTVGISFAIARLQKAQIFCVNPQRVNVSGKLDVMCFDKTGTLTEDGLDVEGSRPVVGGRFRPLRRVSEAPLSLASVFATCHSLTYVGEELVGDPLDLMMFEATTWSFEEPNDAEDLENIAPPVVRPPSSYLEEVANEDKQDLSLTLDDELLSLANDGLPTEIGILRRFDFSSNLQRMSVITRTLGKRHLQVQSKGSPEVIRALCKPETIPLDFQIVLDSYTQRGFRVLGCASKELPVSWTKAQRMKREEIEVDLEFLGLLIMHNRPKIDTSHAITTLNAARIRNVVVTGDHTLTAISVARETNIIPSENRVLLGTVDPGDDHAIQWNFLEDVNVEVDVREIENDSERHLPSSAQSSPFLRHNTLSSGEVTPIDLEAPVHRSYGEPGDEYSEDEDYGSFDVGPPDISVPLLGGSGDLHPFPETDETFEIAVTGKAFRLLLHDLRHDPDFKMGLKVLREASVFARMSPEDKTSLVEALQDDGSCVGMCGDGANDCGALKAAQVGISLSEAEASAAAPFTSAVSSISCVVKLIREGRAALVTSFQCFKYMGLYSIIQFITVTELYQIDSNLGDYQFLWIDLFLIMPLAMFMSRTGAYHRLVARQPSGSLISLGVLVSLIGQMLVLLGFQLFVYLYLLPSQDWYKKYIPDPESKNINCAENATAFLFSNFQYIGTAVSLSASRPFRKPMYTNWLFTGSVIVLSAMSLYLLLCPDTWTLQLFQLYDLPQDFRWILLATAASNFAVIWLHENYLSAALIRGLRRAHSSKRRRSVPSRP